eukprot:6287685-Amphidinium_carterae.1
MNANQPSCVPSTVSLAAFWRLSPALHDLLSRPGSDTASSAQDWRTLDCLHCSHRSLSLATSCVWCHLH